jgi:hypothetical protein
MDCISFEMVLYSADQTLGTTTNNQSPSQFASLVVGPMIGKTDLASPLSPPPPVAAF